MRFALRQLAKSPGFTAAAVAVLALGIGANTAIFSVVEAALLRPLPFPEPDRLVRLYEAYDTPDTRANTLNLSEITLRQWRDHGGAIFSSLAAATGSAVTVGHADGTPARTVNAARITANFFPTLGLPPVRGRSFTAEEDRPGGPNVAIVSHGFWQRELGGRADAVGRTVTLDNAPYTVVGIMPENFRHPYRAEVWLPLAAAFAPGNRGHYLYGVARLQPGVTLAQADAAVRRLCAAVNAAAPDPLNPRRAYVRPLREGFIVDLQPRLLLIAAAALCALLIAATNFSGLLLARTIAREGELAIRSALGATRGRLVRGLVAQALVLATLGTAAGLLVAAWLTPVLVALSPEGSDTTGSALREFDHAVRLDWPVFAFATGALLLVGAGFGLLPAWRGSRPDLRAAMNGGGRSATLDRDRRRLLSLLVVGEIAAATVLLVGSMLFTQTFRRLLHERWGFATEHRLAFNTMLPGRLFATPGARLQAVDRTLAELRALPGVRSATVTLPHPLESARQLFAFNAEGTPSPEPRGFYLAYLRATAPGYFAAAGQALLRGRDFSADDRIDTAPVCIVSESFARRFWPGRSALGRRVKWGRVEGSRPWYTIVGIVADTKVVADPNDGEIDGTICLPLPQLLGATTGFDEFTFVIDTAGEPRALESAARGALTRADSRLAAYEVDSLEAGIAASRTTERFLLVLVSLFGALGLVLAAIGLYGLLSLQVARRTREFGIRSALGSTAAGLVQLVAAEGARLLAAGFFLGSAIAWAALRLAQSYWPELVIEGPLPYLAAAAVLALAVALACWLPARRAARVDPMTALRAE